MQSARRGTPFVRKFGNLRLPRHVSRDEILHFKLQRVSAVILEESFERFSCLAFIFENSKYREAGLKHKFQSARF